MKKANQTLRVSSQDTILAVTRDSFKALLSNQKLKAEAIEVLDRCGDEIFNVWAEKFTFTSLYDFVGVLLVKRGRFKKFDLLLANVLDNPNAYLDRKDYDGGHTTFLERFHHFILVDCHGDLRRAGRRLRIPYAKVKDLVLSVVLDGVTFARVRDKFDFSDEEIRLIENEASENDSLISAFNSAWR